MRLSNKIVPNRNVNLLQESPLIARLFLANCLGQPHAVTPTKSGYTVELCDKLKFPQSLRAKMTKKSTHTSNEIHRALGQSWVTSSVPYTKN